MTRWIYIIRIMKLFILKLNQFFLLQSSSKPQTGHYAETS